MVKSLKDTVDGMLSANYEDRLVAEYDQVQYRLGKLYDVLKKYATLELDHELNCDIEVLRCQAEAMEVYLSCLADRLYGEKDCDCCDHKA